jgi:hypothetical protein
MTIGENSMLDGVRSTIDHLSIGKIIRATA